MNKLLSFFIFLSLIYTPSATAKKSLESRIEKLEDQVSIMSNYLKAYNIPVDFNKETTIFGKLNAGSKTFYLNSMHTPASSYPVDVYVKKPKEIPHEVDKRELKEAQKEVVIILSPVLFQGLPISIQEVTTIVRSTDITKLE